MGLCLSRGHTQSMLGQGQHFCKPNPEPLRQLKNSSRLGACRERSGKAALPCSRLVPQFPTHTLRAEVLRKPHHKALRSPAAFSSPVSQAELSESCVHTAAFQTALSQNTATGDPIPALTVHPLLCAPVTSMGAGQSCSCRSGCHSLLLIRRKKAAVLECHRFLLTRP